MVTSLVAVLPRESLTVTVYFKDPEDCNVPVVNELDVDEDVITDDTFGPL